MTAISRYGNSAFWLDIDNENNDIIQADLTYAEKKSKDLYKLASYRRAIGNFVSIVSNDNIPVKFAERGDSFTDSKTVTISSKLDKPKEFDVAVGLSLHEGSHVKLTDFNLIRKMATLVPEYIKDAAIKRGILNPFAIVKNLMNVIEDRRIDYYIYSTSPGYRDYYHALYDKYFNSKIVDRALESSEYREETVDSYMFRIINIHNKNTDLDALKGLREINDIIDVPRIGRLKDSKAAFDVALDVFKVILKYVNTTPSNNEEGDGNGEGQTSGKQSDEENQSDEGNDGQGSGEDQSDEENQSDEGNDGQESGEDQSDDGDTDGKNSGSGDKDDTATDNTNSMDASDNGMDSDDNNKSSGNGNLSDKEMDRLSKKIEKQNKFLDGEINKKGISKKDANTLETIESSGSEIKTVGTDYLVQGVECIVVKRLTNELFNSDMFPYTISRNGEVRMYHLEEVNRGIKIGTVLGKKLKIRNEDRSTVFNRQRNGKIDKRMISKLGFGDESVFQYTEIDQYKKANIHVSIDASYSMRGSRWRQTLTNTVALCKAIDMISNIEIQVSIRSTNEKGKPYIVLAYDSRVDSFSKVRRMFPAFRPEGFTPEGLTFEAIIKEFVSSDYDTDSYFLNLSDGEPYIPANMGHGGMYIGDPAVEYTKKMVDKIRSKGIRILSYFITSGNKYDNPASDEFKRMYGRSAKSIDVTNINQIVKTVNDLFMEKE